jgi:hypothetical protein
MKASFDGMRRNATNNMNSLYDILQTVVSDESYQRIDEDLKDEIIRKFNDSAMSIDIFNCLFDDSVEDDMNDLSDALSINRINE